MYCWIEPNACKLNVKKLRKLLCISGTRTGGKITLISVSVYIVNIVLHIKFYVYVLTTIISQVQSYSKLWTRPMLKLLTWLMKKLAAPVKIMLPSLFAKERTGVQLKGSLCMLLWKSTTTQLLQRSGIFLWSFLQFMAVWERALWEVGSRRYCLCREAFEIPWIYSQIEGFAM